MVEAATEKLDIKAEIFRDLDRLCRPEIILASNTSSISITKLAALTKRPDRVIGMHFFNPVPMKNLVEVIRGLMLRRRRNFSDCVRDLALKLEKIRSSKRRSRLATNCVLMHYRQAKYRRHVRGQWKA